MIRFDKLTLKSQEALQAAQTHAQEKGSVCCSYKAGVSPAAYLE